MRTRTLFTVSLVLVACFVLVAFAVRAQAPRSTPPMAASAAVQAAEFSLDPDTLVGWYEGPVQPIFFSHRRHAGVYEIECLYCHSEAEKGAHATVPSIATCMNCHAQVEPKDEQGKLKPGIETLKEHWEQKKPLIWNKVHDLADFVYFDHSQHMAADITCQECHGPVETLEYMRRKYGMKGSF